MGQRLFQSIRKSLKEQDTWANSDKHLLSHACLSEQRARRARAAQFDPESGSVVFSVKGSRGQFVPSPELLIAEKAERAFIDCLKELGLSPRARKQLEIEVGKGSGGAFGGAFG